jgi:hypothetical protein
MEGIGVDIDYVVNIDLISSSSSSSWTQLG